MLFTSKGSAEQAGIHLATCFEEQAAQTPQKNLWDKIVAAFAGAHIQPDIMSGVVPPVAPVNGPDFTDKGDLLERFLSALSGIDPAIMREMKAECAATAVDYERTPPFHDLMVGMRDGPHY